MLRLERDTWSMAERLRQATIEDAPPRWRYRGSSCSFPFSSSIFAPAPPDGDVLFAVLFVRFQD